MKIPKNSKLIKCLEELKTRYREVGRGEEFFNILNLIHFNSYCSTRLNLVDKLILLKDCLESGEAKLCL